MPFLSLALANVATSSKCDIALSICFHAELGTPYRYNPHGMYVSFHTLYRQHQPALFKQCHPNFRGFAWNRKEQNVPVWSVPASCWAILLRVEHFLMVSIKTWSPSFYEVFLPNYFYLFCVCVCLLYICAGCTQSFLLVQFTSFFFFFFASIYFTKMAR